VTPAEELREAARLMRERAQAATPGPWGGYEADAANYVVDYSGDDEGVLGPVAEQLDTADAEHIASWHPMAALAVADWLDATAAGVGWHSLSPRGPYVEGAIAVARAYLGGGS
jgi:hypothetical protein